MFLSYIRSSFDYPIRCQQVNVGSVGAKQANQTTRIFDEGLCFARLAPIDPLLTCWQRIGYSLIVQIQLIQLY